MSPFHSMLFSFPVVTMTVGIAAITAAVIPMSSILLPGTALGVEWGFAGVRAGPSVIV